jgi:hemolysin activation/secretion protein
MQLGVFFDVATGDQNNPQAGESPKESLSSVGLAYRWNIRSDLSFQADFGYVLDGIDQTFSNGTDDGDSRVHLSLKYYPRWPFGGVK